MVRKLPKLFTRRLPVESLRNNNREPIFGGGLKDIKRPALQPLDENEIKNMQQRSRRVFVPATIRNTQKKVPINIANVHRDIDVIRRILEVEDYSVDIWFASEKKVQELNSEHRGKDKNTDVLSFPFLDFSKPEVFEFSKETMIFNSERLLGDIVISSAYILERCLEDKAYFDKNGIPDDVDDDGVSKAMATRFTVEERVPLLLIHSVLHLLGYDHETDADWKVMTKRENEVISRYYKELASQKDVPQD